MDTYYLVRLFTRLHTNHSYWEPLCYLRHLRLEILEETNSIYVSRISRHR